MNVKPLRTKSTVAQYNRQDMQDAENGSRMSDDGKYTANYISDDGAIRDSHLEGR